MMLLSPLLSRRSSSHRRAWKRLTHVSETRDGALSGQLSGRDAKITVDDRITLTIALQELDSTDITMAWPQRKRVMAGGPFRSVSVTGGDLFWATVLASPDIRDALASLPKGSEVRVADRRLKLVVPQVPNVESHLGIDRIMDAGLVISSTILAVNGMSSTARLVLLRETVETGGLHPDLHALRHVASDAANRYGLQPPSRRRLDVLAAVGAAQTVAATN